MSFRIAPLVEVLAKPPSPIETIQSDKTRSIVIATAKVNRALLLITNRKLSEGSLIESRNGFENLDA